MIIAHTYISANYYMPDTDLRTLQKVSWVSILQAGYLLSGGYCVIFFSIYLSKVMFFGNLPISLCTLLLFWLRWVFIATCGLSPLVAANGGYLLVAVRGLLTSWFLLLQIMGSRYAGLLWVVALLHVESSWPRDWTGVLCIGGRILNHWITREALTLHFWFQILEIK